MDIIVAKSGGFCMGVRRAVDLALKEAEDKSTPLCSLGPLIHNNQAVAYLERQGVRVALDTPHKGRVIIRAHGVSPETLRILEKAGLEVIDATCPHVLSSQKIIDREVAENRHVIIFGDQRHPEVQSLCGHAPGACHVVTDYAGLIEIPVDLPVSVVAQTTFSSDGYRELSQEAARLFVDCRIFGTICDATEKRQTEVVDLCEKCGVLVVVGGRNSANTCRLAQIGRDCGAKVFHIETSVELQEEDFAENDVVAVTAGASTPDCVLDMVLLRLRTFAGDVLN